ERTWAWQARPLRPALYAALLLATIVGVGPFKHWAWNTTTNALADAIRPLFDEALALAMPEGPQPIEAARLPAQAPKDWTGWRAGDVWFAAPARFVPADPEGSGTAFRLQDSEGVAVAVEKVQAPAGGCDEALERTRAERFADFTVRPFRFGGTGQASGLRID